MDREKLIKYFSNFQRRRPQRERRVDGQPRVGRALLAAVAADGGRLGPAVHSLHRVKDGRMEEDEKKRRTSVMTTRNYEYYIRVAEQGLHYIRFS